MSFLITNIDSVNSNDCFTTTTCCFDQILKKDLRHYTIMFRLIGRWRLGSSTYICSIGDKSGDNPNRANITIILILENCANTSHILYYCVGTQWQNPVWRRKDRTMFDKMSTRYSTFKIPSINLRFTQPDISLPHHSTSPKMIRW